MKWNAQQYAEAGLEGTIRRPAECPNCRKSLTLEAHGFYSRWVSAIRSSGGAVRIRVRRFFAALAGAP
jgi:hypothetical protein